MLTCFPSCKAVVLYLFCLAVFFTVLCYTAGLVSAFQFSGL